MTDHMTEANDYLDGYTDAFNGIQPARDTEKYREGHEAGRTAYLEQWQGEPAPFCAPGDDDCEACQ